nr:MAG TPA: LIN37 [Caudoviricetes sp.]
MGCRTIRRRSWRSNDTTTYYASRAWVANKI